MELIELTDQQAEALDDALSAYDDAHMPRPMAGSVRIGLAENGRVVAGLDGCVTSFRTLYVSTVFVAEEWRRRGLGRRLMAEMERRAEAMGVTVIRLDTFDWQGVAFYRALGYEEAGHYDAPEDGFSEHFFVKRLKRPENGRVADGNL